MLLDLEQISQLSLTIDLHGEMLNFCGLVGCQMTGEKTEIFSTSSSTPPPPLPKLPIWLLVYTHSQPVIVLTSLYSKNRPVLVIIYSTSIVQCPSDHLARSALHKNVCTSLFALYGTSVIILTPLPLP